jgi:hypothetical protein
VVYNHLDYEESQSVCSVCTCAACPACATTSPALLILPRSPLFPIHAHYNNYILCCIIAMNNHMTVITSTDAERIADDILSTIDGILGVSIMDMRGNPLAVKSKESFKEAFGVTQDRGKYGGTLAVAVLSVVNEVRNIFGGPKAIITVHESCKLMLVPVPSFQILVGLVLQCSVNAEDDDIGNKIERLLADMLWQ